MLTGMSEHGNNTNMSKVERYWCVDHKITRGTFVLNKNMK